MTLAGGCRIPSNLAPNIQLLNISRVQNNLDIMRNRKYIKEMCIYSIYFKENSTVWNMMLVFNKNHPNGPFWFIPHDNENSAFDSAVYATIEYGGGFLAVETGGRRNNHGIDPNRNFSTKRVRGRCSSSPIYTNVVFRVIEYFKRDSSMPYLSLHSNSNGFRGDGRGGRGSISILKNSGQAVKSYPAYKKILKTKRGGLRDEDYLVYIAGKTKKPPIGKLNRVIKAGFNVKYETVSSKSNDCSMSNFVVLGKGSTNYYNIEVEHGDVKTQKSMIDRLMRKVLGLTPLRR
jgi:hypothetical protein